MANKTRANKTSKSTERLFTTYEQTADQEHNGQTDTRTMHEWYLYYLQYVDSTEYPIFITWFFAMLKSGKLIEEK